jgi:hypothetical protein
VNRWGNRDLGVAQAADCTRTRMIALYDAGVVDVRFEDEDYFDPWKGTRFVALWVGLLLDEVHGDLEMAVRAYHRGSARALRGEGTEYLEAMKRRLHRFVRNEDRRGAWDYVWNRDRVLTAQSRPWLSAPSDGARRGHEPVDIVGALPAPRSARTARAQDGRSRERTTALVDETIFEGR